ncbi:MAG: hypothetical protein GF334_00340 [Candidatus Altiarchaeales archaeon]|nr:hypothetical protein [Candidatus Altiarchaeales archaeon]
MVEARKDVRLQKHLLSGETLVDDFALGLYDVYLTDSRIIFFKNFPGGFQAVPLTDVEDVDYLRLFRLNELIKVLALFIGFAYLLLNQQAAASVFNGVYSCILPQLGFLVSADRAAHIFLLIVLTYLLMHLNAFLIPFFGVLEVHRKNHQPLRLPTLLSGEPTALIKRLDEHIMGLSELTCEVDGDEDDSDSYCLRLSEFKRKLSESLTHMDDKAVVSVSTSSVDHLPTVSALLDILTRKRGLGGVYISFTQPYQYLAEAVKQANVPLDDLFFIDCISKMAAKIPSEPKENVVFVENPSSLEEVNVHLNRMLDRVSSPKKFIFLDSLTSLLIYNDEKSVNEFSHFIINKARLSNIFTVLLFQKKEGAGKLHEKVEHICDKKIVL